MPLPIAPNPELIPANRIFVNRDGALRLFEQLATNIPADGAELLVFYGVSGQGKSALSREFKKFFAAKSDRFCGYPLRPRRL